MITFPDPLVMLQPAKPPMAILQHPVVTLQREPYPIATLVKPELMFRPAKTPRAVLHDPVVRPQRESQPTDKLLTVEVEQPKTNPATKGVANEAPAAGVTQASPVAQAAQAERT
jgi:hypothetical protein